MELIIEYERALNGPAVWIGALVALIVSIAIIYETTPPALKKTIAYALAGVPVGALVAAVFIGNPVLGLVLAVAIAAVFRVAFTRGK